MREPHLSRQCVAATCCENTGGLARGGCLQAVPGDARPAETATVLSLFCTEEPFSLDRWIHVWNRTCFIDEMKRRGCHGGLMVVPESDTIQTASARKQPRRSGLANAQCQGNRVDRKTDQVTRHHGDNFHEVFDEKGFISCSAAEKVLLKSRFRNLGAAVPSQTTTRADRKWCSTLQEGHSCSADRPSTICCKRT